MSEEQPETTFEKVISYDKTWKFIGALVSIATILALVYFAMIAGGHRVCESYGSSIDIDTFRCRANFINYTNTQFEGATFGNFTLDGYN